MPEKIKSVYAERAGAYRMRMQKNVKQLSLLSVARLILFAGFAWLLVVTFRNGYHGYYLISSLVCLIFFFICVYRTAIVRKENKFLQQLLLINENEINLFHGKPSSLSNGSVYALSKGFTVDLNVFGSHSLYHLLNRTGSITGKQQLARRLSDPFMEPAPIVNYQECVHELSGHIEFRQTLLAHALLLEEEEALPQLQTGISDGSFEILQKGVWRWLSLCWPVAGIIITLYSIWRNHYAPMLAFMILGLLLLTLILKKINLLYYHISKRSYLYSQYAKCFRLINAEKFSHPYLLQKQEAIKHAERAFHKLSKLTGLFDLRLSMFSLFINGLFLFDLICAKAYIQWNRQYQAHSKNWFDTLGEMEVLNSLATFHYNHPSFIFPQPADEQLFIKAVSLGHPLMNTEAAVLNDLSIGNPEKLHLITGSNMSGKSTFLRTVGLNMILAQSGAPVFASTFFFRPVRLLTSFHHIDSLEESTSYFYAELKCLQSIIESLTRPVPALVLLDEVMRGTNSKDKHDGTALLIKKIITYQHCLALIASHDIELGALAEADPGAIGNFCFETDLSENGLTFDFIMRKGVAQTKNATYLMQQMGII